LLGTSSDNLRAGGEKHMEEITIQNMRLDCSPAVHLMLGTHRYTLRDKTRG